MGGACRAYCRSIHRLPAVALSLLLFVAVGAGAAPVFLAIGDWGASALDDPQYSRNTNAVAATLAETARRHGAEFIVNTGDCFYWCGIQNTSDFQIAVDWEQPYNLEGLKGLPWYGVLGNHEYGYNVSAVLDYASLNPAWVMDGRYYRRRVALHDIRSGTGDSGGRRQFLSFVFIDTSPCVRQYRSEDDAGWDPCGAEYPHCSPTSDDDVSHQDDDFEGPCRFHDNIVAQDCARQLAWFRAALAAVPEDDWLVVVGHHSADEVNVEDFASVMRERGVDLYLNGHAHMLAQYTVGGAGAFATSGAGSMVDTADQTDGAMLAKKSDCSNRHRRATASGTTASGGDDGHESKGSNPRGGSAGVVGNSGHNRYQTVWCEIVAGFTRHTFSDDFQSLTTDFVDYAGNVIRSFTVQRGVPYQPDLMMHP